MHYIEKVLGSIPYHTIKPTSKERLNLRRVPSKHGTIEFTVLDQKKYAAHKHNHTHATLIVLTGKGTAILDKKRIRYKPGDILDIPKGTMHGFEIKQKTIVLSIQSKEILNHKTGKIDIRYDR